MPRTFLKLVAVAVLAGCARSEPAYGSTATTDFLCEGGYYFSVEYLGGQVRVLTAAGSYLLAERPSSIGRKFSAGEATFIHDEDRAALNGVPGGPFRRCRELGTQVRGELPPLPETIELNSIDYEQDVIVPGMDDEPS